MHTTLSLDNIERTRMILSFDDFESVILDIDDLIVNRAQHEENELTLHEDKIKALLKKQGFDFSDTVP